MNRHFSVLKYIFLLILIITVLPFKYMALAQDKLQPEPVSAESVVLLEARTGKVLYSVKADERIPTGSIIPLLITMLAQEKVSPEDYMLVSENSTESNTNIVSLSNAGPAGLKKGERLQYSELFKAILLGGSLDAYRSVVTNVFGTELDFINQVQQKLKALNLNNTKITSVLTSNKNDYTTVYDSAQIMKAFSQNIKLLELLKHPSYTFVPNNMVPEGRKITNPNLTLDEKSDFYYNKSFGGTISFKNPEEGLNNFLNVSGDNESLVVVSFGNSVSATDSFADSAKLSEWVFKNFNTVKLISKGTRISEWPVSSGTPLELLAGSDFYYFEEKTSIPTKEFGINFKPLNLSGEIKKGQQMGYAEIIVADKPVGEVSLVSSGEVKVAPYASKLKESTSSNNIIFKVILGMIILGAIAMIVRTVNKIKRSRKRRKEIEKKRMLLKSEVERERRKKEQRDRRSRINRSGF